MGFTNDDNARKIPGIPRNLVGKSSLMLKNTNTADGIYTSKNIEYMSTKIRSNRMSCLWIRQWFSTDPTDALTDPAEARRILAIYLN